MILKRILDSTKLKIKTMYKFWIFLIRLHPVLRRKKGQSIHTVDDTNQTSQKETDTSTIPTWSANSTCSQQCISSANNIKVNGIPQCNNRIITSKDTLYSNRQWLVNRIGAMAVNKRPLLGVFFLMGCISLKNWT